MSVGMILKNYGYRDEVVIAGILHDVIEDTKYTKEDIVKLFGKDVANLVCSASEPDKSLSWEERKKYTLEYTKTLPLESKLIICADKINNLSSDRDRYDSIGDKIWDNLERGRKKQEWYYRGILSSVRYNEDDNELFRRYEKILDYLFR